MLNFLNSPTFLPNLGVTLLYFTIICIASWIVAKESRKEALADDIAVIGCGSLFFSVVAVTVSVYLGLPLQ